MSQLDAYEVDPLTACLLWTGKMSSNGRYGIVWRGRKPSSAHKVVYEAEHGPVPDGLVIEHGCARPRCVQTLHMTLVTKSINEQLKNFSARLRRFKRCKAGHVMEFERIMTERGFVCRACARAFLEKHRGNTHATGRVHPTDGGRP